MVGPSILALTADGTISDATAIGDFPVADASGALALSATYQFDLSDPGELARYTDLRDRFTGRELQIHGRDVSAGAGAGTPNEVDGTAGYKAVLPVGNGILLPVVQGDAGDAAVLALVERLLGGTGTTTGTGTTPGADDARDGGRRRASADHTPLRHGVRPCARRRRAGVLDRRARSARHHTRQHRRRARGIAGVPAAQRNLSDTEFVTLLYRNGLEREARAGRAEFWVSGLQRRATDRGDVLSDIADSPEGVASALTQGVSQPGTGTTGTGTGTTTPATDRPALGRRPLQARPHLGQPPRSLTERAPPALVRGHDDARHDDRWDGYADRHGHPTDWHSDDHAGHDRDGNGDPGYRWDGHADCDGSAHRTGTGRPTPRPARQERRPREPRRGLTTRGRNPRVLRPGTPGTDGTGTQTATGTQHRHQPERRRPGPARSPRAPSRIRRTRASRPQGADTQPTGETGHRPQAATSRRCEPDTDGQQQATGGQDGDTDGQQQVAGGDNPLSNGDTLPTGTNVSPPPSGDQVTASNNNVDTDITWEQVAQQVIENFEQTGSWFYDGPLPDEQPDFEAIGRQLVEGVRENSDDVFS